LTLPGHGFYWFQLTEPSEEDSPTASHRHDQTMEES
jgi:maltose alpha-D-glucosyltransferase / alpha-amylase